ncbi:F-box/kelch-repeat protein SKIP25 [Striga hermonthica]|uniref:F-box/kelch-repeat protein SKIP25 n=1 Tax=Striga hermonthica TaxID=68872 RepID=A0A9N7NZX7_STRHE|nr:F-box/kelch-repeat protein SKIP25 [Striga hermonthica]
MHAPKEYEHSSARDEPTGPQNEPVLVPGLPAHLALLCLSPLKPSLLYKVCKPWRSLIYSPDFPPFFALYAVLSQVSARPVSSDPDSIWARGCHSNSISLACFDPISAKDGRFCREGIEAVGYDGNKLCMVNVNGARSVKQGAVYDVVEDRWEEMPRGMLGGWNGPVSVDECDERAMYVVDWKDGSISTYDRINDRWVGVVGGLEKLKGAEKVAVRGGKMCVVSEEGRQILVVDVLTRPPNVWVVEPPGGTEVVAVHVLPRMAIPEDELF